MFGEQPFKVFSQPDLQVIFGLNVIVGMIEGEIRQMKERYDQDRRKNK